MTLEEILANASPDVRNLNSDVPKRSYVEFDVDRPKTAKRRNKFNAKRIEADGHKFDSKAEFRRYCILVEQQQRGEIHNLEVHPVYQLIKSFKRHGKTIRGVKYTADFRYQLPDGNTVVEDVKGGKATIKDGYRVRAKLLQWLNPEIIFREVRM